MSAERLIEISRALGEQVDRLTFAAPVHTTYNPLTYAWAPHEAFLRRHGGGDKRYLWLGMNPGPFGMGQTGVPFGDVPSVRDWIGVEAPVAGPSAWHPKRPIVGFALTRREGSGKRLWGWAEKRFGTADAFFAEHYVHNYCPLFFVEDSGRNRVPERLPKSEREPLFAACDQALRDVHEALQPEAIVAIGAFARKCAERVLADRDATIVQILHPSPASPAANRGWAEAVEPVLWDAGVRWPNDD